MGWGWGSLLRSDSLARCEKQKDKRLWTDYSRLDIMHHLRYDGTYRLSWSWVKVLMSIRWCPVCCRDMFHKDLSTATESAAILSTAQEMMYFTKTNLKRSYFRFASPPTTESRKGWNCRCFKVCREGVFCYLQKLSVFSLFSKERHITNSPVWPVLTVLITSFEKRRQKWTLKTFYETL